MRADEIRIPSPCQEDWEAMRVERGGRYCDACKHTVVDLSRMSEAEARALLEGRPADDLCVAYVVTPEGQIRFRSDRPTSRPLGLGSARARAPRGGDLVPLSRLRSPRAATLAVAMAACTPHGAIESPDSEDLIEALDYPDAVIPIATEPTPATGAPEPAAEEPCDAPAPTQEEVFKGKRMPEPPAPAHNRPRMGKPISRPDPADSRVVGLMG